MRHALAFILVAMTAARTAEALQWTEVGGSATGGGISAADLGGGAPSVAMDAQGRIYVAWQTGGDRPEIYLKMWNLVEWVELGGSATDGGISGTPAKNSVQPVVKIDNEGKPVVAWKETTFGSLGTKIFLRRFDGTQWRLLGATALAGVSGQGGKNSSRPSMAIDSLNHPILAWEEQVTAGAKYEIWLATWDGNAWVGLGGSFGGGGISKSDSVPSTSASVAVGPAGKVGVAWLEDGNVYMRQWDPAAPLAWTGLGASATGRGVSFDVDGEELVSIDSAVLCYHAPTGLPGVAWGETKFNANHNIICSDIFFRYADNQGAWHGLAGSAGPGGISNTRGQSASVSMAIEAGGATVIAWKEVPLVGHSEIHLKRYSSAATGWSEVFASATGGGVSSSPYDSHVPAVAAVVPGQPYIAWVDEPADSVFPQVYLKAVNGAPAAASVAQVRTDGAAAVPVGATILETGLLLEVSVADPQGNTVRVEVEVEEIGTDFDAANTQVSPPFANGSVAVVPLEGLPRAKSYHWRLRVIDSLDAASPWTAFGDNSEAETDFSVRSNELPVAELRDLHDPDDGGTLSPGERFFSETGVGIRSMLSDADGDEARIEIEARLIGDPFTGVPVATSPSGGGEIVMRVDLPGGAYHLQIRGVDALGEASPWISAWTNGESEADFILFHPGGSLGIPMKSVACSGGADPGISLLPALLILSLCAILGTGPARKA